ncbi:MAG: TetR/AcrR family transcriptional regulator [Pseudomonadota bacterium]
MRSKAFNPDDALRGALERFWSHGYHGTNMPELMAAMGITRGSFYGTFGSKIAAFTSAFETYLASVDRFGRRTVSGCAGRREAVLQVLTGILGLTQAEDGWRGCLIGNTAREAVAREKDIQVLLDRGMSVLCEIFDLALALPEADAPDLDPGQRTTEALRLATFLQGLLVASRCGATEDDLTRLIAREVETLP